MAELGIFEKMLIIGLVIIGFMVIAFGGIYTGTPRDTGLSSYYTGSPIFVGAADTNAVETQYVSFDANNFIQTNAFNLGARRVSSGLLFGSNPVTVDVSQSENIVARFDVTATNGYGNLIIKVDGNVLFNQRVSEGHYEVPLGAGRVVEISSESSDWKIWAPAVYDLENLVLASSIYPKEKTTYTFEVNNPSDIQSVRVDFYMDNNEGAMTMKLNGDVVYDGALNPTQTIYLDPSKLDDVNILTFDAHQDSKFAGRATIAITRKTWSQKDFIMDINMTDAEYGDFLYGTVSFDVVDVFKPGGYSVTIYNNGLVLKQEYAKLEKGYFVLNLERNDLRPGLNTVVVHSVDGSAFNIQGVLTRL